LRAAQLLRAQPIQPGAPAARDAVVEGGSLRNAQTRLTRFEGADLRGTDITGLNVMDGKHFRKAVVSQRQAAAALASFGLIVA